MEVFATEADMQTRKTYVEAIARSAPIFAEYDYVAGVVHLRLSSNLTPDQAAVYQRALADAVK